MNGELFHLCRMVIAAKKALKKDNGNFIYEPFKYENSVNFTFLPKNSLFHRSENHAKGAEKWFEVCKSRGLTDIKLLTPIGVKNRSVLGFSNTNQSCILCFYNKEVTFFTAEWSFDRDRKKWDIMYTERPWDNPPKEKPFFRNNSEPFKLVLELIRDLAKKIDCGRFADIFQRAADILKGECDINGLEFPYTLLPEENVRLLKAADISDVFGAMGSWNDSPPYMAHEKGLDKEYDALSAELLKQMRLAILFAVNNW